MRCCHPWLSATTGAGGEGEAGEGQAGVQAAGAAAVAGDSSKATGTAEADLSLLSNVIGKSCNDCRCERGSVPA
jgi:hypothetical protein